MKERERGLLVRVILSAILAITNNPALGTAEILSSSDLAITAAPEQTIETAPIESSFSDPSISSSLSEPSPLSASEFNVISDPAVEEKRTEILNTVDQRIVGAQIEIDRWIDWKMQKQPGLDHDLATVPQAFEAAFGLLDLVRILEALRDSGVDPALLPEINNVLTQARAMLDPGDPENIVAKFEALMDQYMHQFDAIINFWSAFKNELLSFRGDVVAATTLSELQTLEGMIPVAGTPPPVMNSFVDLGLFTLGDSSEGMIDALMRLIVSASQAKRPEELAQLYRSIFLAAGSSDNTPRLGIYGDGESALGLVDISNPRNKLANIAIINSLAMKGIDYIYRVPVAFRTCPPLEPDCSLKEYHDTAREITSLLDSLGIRYDIGRDFREGDTSPDRSNFESWLATRWPQLQTLAYLRGSGAGVYAVHEAMETFFREGEAGLEKIESMIHGILPDAPVRIYYGQLQRALFPLRKMGATQRLIFGNDPDQKGQDLMIYRFSGAAHISLNATDASGDAFNLASILLNAVGFHSLLNHSQSESAERVFHINVPADLTDYLSRQKGLTSEQIAGLSNTEREAYGDEFSDLIATSIVALWRSNVADVIMIRPTNTGQNAPPQTEHFEAIMKARALLARIENAEDLTPQIRQGNWDADGDGIVDYEDLLRISGKLDQAGTIQSWLDSETMDILDRDNNGQITGDDAFYGIDRSVIPLIGRIIEKTAKWETAPDGSLKTFYGGQSLTMEVNVGEAGDYDLRVSARNIFGGMAMPVNYNFQLQAEVDGVLVPVGLNIVGDSSIYHHGTLRLTGLAAGLHRIKLFWTNAIYDSVRRLDTNLQLDGIYLEKVETDGPPGEGVQLVNRSRDWEVVPEGLLRRTNYGSLTYVVNSIEANPVIAVTARLRPRPGWSIPANYEISLAVYVNGKRQAAPLKVRGNTSGWEEASYQLNAVSGDLVTFVWENAQYDQRLFIDTDMIVKDVRIFRAPVSADARAIEVATKYFKSKFGALPAGATFTVTNTPASDNAVANTTKLLSRAVEIKDANGQTMATLDVIESLYSSGVEDSVVHTVTDRADPAGIETWFHWDPLLGYTLSTLPALS